MAKKDTSPDFESALESLEKLVEQMESGDLSLENSLEQFERGMALTKLCQDALSAAQLRVDKLLEEQANTGDAAVEDED